MLFGGVSGPCTEGPGHFFTTLDYMPRGRLQPCKTLAVATSDEVHGFDPGAHLEVQDGMDLWMVQKCACTAVKKHVFV